MSFLDSITGGGDSDAQNYLRKALEQYQSVQVPTSESMRVNGLPEETIQGTVTPEQISAVDQDPSAYNNISLDPEGKQAQRNALAAYQNIIDNGGSDAEAKLAMQNVVDDAQRQSQGAQGAIQQQAQATGNGGGDFALTQKAIAAQGASNNAATQGMQAAAIAQANRQKALESMATLGGNMDAADFSQKARAADAQDSINAVNQGYRNNANVGNVANNMESQKFNVTNAQDVNRNNTTAKQGNVYYNANLPQVQFNNELAKAGGMAGVNAQQASAANNAANNNAAFTGKLLGTAGTVGGAMLGGPAGAAVGGAVGSAAAPKYKQASDGVNAAHGGTIPQCYAAGGTPHDHGLCMTIGGMVPGQAQVPGDSEQNDTVDAKLSPGELVIPRSVPKDGPSMEAFARQAPVAGTNKKVDLTSFTNGYKRGR